MVASQHHGHLCSLRSGLRNCVARHTSLVGTRATSSLSGRGLQVWEEATAGRGSRCSVRSMISIQRGPETGQGRELACVYWYQLASLPFLGAPDPSLSSWGLPVPGKEGQTPPRTRGAALSSLSGGALVRGDGLGRRGSD